MTDLTLRILSSVKELRAAASDWDDLWWRSDVALPTCRAAALALWLEHFAPHDRFHALVVERAGKFVGALPLVRKRWNGLFHVAMLPNSPWCVAADLLVDPASDVAAVCDLLADGLRNGPWSLAMLDEVPFTSTHWRTLLSALQAEGSEVDTRLRFLIGQVEIAGDWHSYESSRSKNHRKHFRQMGRRIEEQGPTELVVETTIVPSELARLLRRGCEVEDRSWKGAEGTSILRSPGIYDFYLRLAQQLSQWQGIELHFLQNAESDAAFQLVFAGKGTLFPAKIAYDPALAKFSPWHVLMHRWLESLHAQHAQDGTPSVVDFYGPLMDASSRWSTRTYPLGKALITTAARASKTLFDALKMAKRWKSKWKPEAPTPLPEIHGLVHDAPKPGKPQPLEEVNPTA
jgi:CelD/BcsL family acetyltransferase involved in cellulose biosynthesis